MKLLPAILLSTFLILNAYCDPCIEAYRFADTSISNLKTKFFAEAYDTISEELQEIMISAEVIQETCGGFLNLMQGITSSQAYTCSLAHSLLSGILENYNVDISAEALARPTLVFTIGQILAMIPSIEDKFCLDEWEVTSVGQDMDIWNDDSYKSDDGDEIWYEEESDEDDDGDELSPFLADGPDEEEEDELRPVGSNKLWYEENEEEDDDLNCYPVFDDDDEQGGDDYDFNANNVEISTIYVDVNVLESNGNQEDILFLEFEEEEGQIMVSVDLSEMEGKDTIVTYVDIFTIENTEPLLEIDLVVAEEEEEAYDAVQKLQVLEIKKPKDSIFLFVDLFNTEDDEFLVGFEEDEVLEFLGIKSIPNEQDIEVNDYMREIMDFDLSNPMAYELDIDQQTFDYEEEEDGFLN